MALRWPRVLAFAFLLAGGTALLGRHPQFIFEPSGPLPDYESQWEEARPDSPKSDIFEVYLSSSIYPEGTMDFPAVWYNKTWRIQNYGLMYELQKWVDGCWRGTTDLSGNRYNFEFPALDVMPHWYRPHSYNTSLNIPYMTFGRYRLILSDYGDTQVTVPFWVIPPFRYE